jgi:colanic acid/amylovoran biosynthesis glycosyltransferase
MRIAFVTGQFPKLSETFILNQVNGLIERGHEVTVYADRPETVQGVQPDFGDGRWRERVRYWHGADGRIREVLRLVQLLHPGRSGERPQQLKLLGRSLRLLHDGAGERDLAFPLRALQAAGLRRRYDAIVAHFGHVGLDALRLRVAGAIEGSLVTFFHGWDMGVFPARRGARVYRRLFAEGELFLAVSRYWRERLIDLGCPRERTDVHRMGIDCRRFAFAARTPAPDGVTRVVSVARLVEKKGIAYALQAMARLVRRHPAIAYTIVGDGPQRPELEALAAHLGLNRRVRFAGWRGPEEVRCILAAVQIFLAPSVTADDGDAEGVPVAMMEAMAVGLPVLGTIHTGIPELVADGVSGYLVPERDADALAAQLERLVGSPASWPAMGRAGRARVEREFDIERLNDRLVERLAEISSAP